MITENSPEVPYDDRWQWLYKYQAQLVHSLAVGEKSNPIQMLTEKMGTGKTLVILGLILASPLPARSIPPLYCHNPAYEQSPYRAKGNIIVCPPAIIEHWKMHIAKFTNLKFYTITKRDDVETMKHLEYDIILISSGKAKNRSKIVADKSIKLQFVKRDVVSYVMLFWAKWNGAVFSRVIYDEYHTMDIGNAVLGNSIILVSSTPKFKKPRFAPYGIFIDLQQMLHYYDVPQVKCNAQYMELLDYVPRMKIYTYLFKTHNKIEKKLLSLMGNDAESYIAERMLYNGKMHEFIINLMLHPYEKRKALQREGKDTKIIDGEIERQREAIFATECPVCCLEMTPKIRIYQCCGCSICNDCTAGGRCPQCATAGVQTYDIDYDKIQELKNEPIEKKFKIVDKLDVIHNIIQGDAVPTSVPVYENAFVKGAILQNGGMYCEPPAGKRLIAILSNYNKIHNKIIEGLNIDYVRLTPKNAYDVSNMKPEDGTKIILINTKQAISGINLPWITDVIITHQYYNQDNFAQIIGRFQRINREYSVKIHQIKFE